MIGELVNIRSWSFGKVILASVFWILLVIGSVAFYIYLQFRQLQSAGSAGIGAVSFGVVNWLALGILFGPPVLLAATWWVLRRRALK